MGSSLPIVVFGKDHWSTFAYIETEVTDNSGVLNPDKMRKSSLRHPVLSLIGEHAQIGSVGSKEYPTRIKGGVLEDGKYGVEEITPHDDYDCVDDLIGAGLLEVTMPQAIAERDVFVDFLGHVIHEDGEIIRPSFLTGRGEQWLMGFAKFRLTEEGWRVASELRQWKSEGGQYHQFQPTLVAPQVVQTKSVSE